MVDHSAAPHRHHHQGPIWPTTTVHHQFLFLCLTDFLHSNIIVDEESSAVTGIIDWEGAYTVPWELVAFPEFLQAMPPTFDLPACSDRDTAVSFL
ncbi:phosphotransferase [Candidatus Bathyarchaeota archaeon]|nr:phosphotransferase [Candidatus Bathyarchaeota archaeon]